MDNVQHKVVDNKLIIVVDLSKEGAKSPSGKSVRIASSEGNIRIKGHPGIRLGLNVFKPILKHQS